MGLKVGHKDVKAGVRAQKVGKINPCCLSGSFNPGHL